MTLLHASKVIGAIGLAASLFPGAYGGLLRDQRLVQRVDNHTTCLTESCIHSASELLYSLSPQYTTIDPCNNFDQLVCGGWQERHDMRADQTRVSTFNSISEASSLLLKHIMGGSAPPLNDSIDAENFAKIKGAYDACMDESALKAAGTAPLTKLLVQVIQLFPATHSNWSRTPESTSGNQTGLPAALGFLRSYSVGSFVSIGVSVDQKSPDTYDVSVSPSGLSLPGKQRYGEEKLFNSFKALVPKVLSTLLPDQALSSTALSAVADFENKIAAITPEAKDLRDITKTYNKLSLKQVSALLPQIDLPAQIAAAAPSNVTITDVTVSSPQFLEDLSGLLSSTSADVLQGYLLWKVVTSYASALDPDAMISYTQFQNQLQGKDPNAKAERWRICLSHVDDNLGWILSRLFVQKSFSQKAKDLGDRIVSDIKAIFIEKIKSKPWIDQSVARVAINKVNKIVQKIGYPTTSPNVMDAATIREYYQKLTVTQSYFDNIVSFRRFGSDRSWSRLGKPVDKGVWSMTAPTVNAYYSPSGNEIVFPAGIMQFPLFDVNTPEYLTYGSFGSVAGHELSHAFDNSGRNYDEDGKYNNWWTNRTIAEFEKRTKCFVEEYNNYTVEGIDGKPLHVNGALTLGENIADAGGVSAAFAAWKKRAVLAPSQSLPGLDFFTPDQMFFVSYATNWCGKIRRDAQVNQVYTDPHSPQPARILYTLANSRDFRQSFNCPVKEPTCELW